jgi:hypothetical protein
MDKAGSPPAAFVAKWTLEDSASLSKAAMAPPCDLCSARADSDEAKEDEEKSPPPSPFYALRKLLRVLQVKCFTVRRIVKVDTQYVLIR